MKRSFGAGADAPASVRTLSDYFERDYFPRRLVGRSGRTATLYRYTIRLFSKYLGRDALLTDLEDLTISRYVAWLIEDGRAPAGVNKERRQLCSLWNAAAKRRLVDQFPDVPPVPQPQHVPKAWTIEELWRLKISCNMQAGDYCGVPANQWWVALHLLLWDTAERISAVMQLRWGDVAGEWVTFRAETRKGRRKPSIKKLRLETVQALEKIRSGSELVFPWPYRATYIYNVYRAILKRAELDHDAKSMFHRMRRSVATHLKAAGMDATAALGHANQAITQEHYIDPRLSGSVQPSDVLPSISEQEI